MDSSSSASSSSSSSLSSSSQQQQQQQQPTSTNYFPLSSSLADLPSMSLSPKSSNTHHPGNHTYYYKNNHYIHNHDTNTNHISNHNLGTLLHIQNHDEQIEIVFEIDTGDTTTTASKSKHTMKRILHKLTEKLSSSSSSYCYYLKKGKHQQLLQQTTTTIMEEDEDDEEEELEQTPKPNPSSSPLPSKKYTRFQIICFGQLLSFLLASISASQSMLEFECNVSAPTFFVGLVFSCLTIIQFIPLYYHSRKDQQQQLRNNNTMKNKNTIQTEQQQQHTVPDKEKQQQQPHPQKQYENETDDKAIQQRQQQQQQLQEEEKGHFLFCNIIPIQGKPIFYIFMAVLEVEAMYFTVLSLKYTTLTSVTLFDALAIPSAMVLSILFLKRKYTKLHILAVMICMMGILLNILQDYYDNDNNSGRDLLHHHTHGYFNKKSYLHQHFHHYHQEDQPSNFYNTNDDDDYGETTNATTNYYPHRFRGDILAILGGIFYGANDVLCEYSVRKLGGPNEFLFVLSCFAAVLSIVQAFFLEYKEIQQIFQIPSSSSVVVVPQLETTCDIYTQWYLIIIFVLVSVFFYIGSAYFLTISESAFMNLSLLTGDFWSVLFSIVAEKIIPTPLFYYALLLITSGVVLYEMNGGDVDKEEMPTTTATGAADANNNVLCVSKQQEWDQEEDHELHLTVEA